MSLAGLEKLKPTALPIFPTDVKFGEIATPVKVEPMGTIEMLVSAIWPSMNWWWK